jgi:predicted transcriptional regulator
MEVNELRKRAQQEGFSNGAEYVLHLINQGAGQSLKGLARALNVADNTIRHHLKGYKPVTRYIKEGEEVIVREKRKPSG